MNILLHILCAKRSYKQIQEYYSIKNQGRINELGNMENKSLTLRKIGKAPCSNTSIEFSVINDPCHPLFGLKSIPYFYTFDKIIAEYPHYSVLRKIFEIIFYLSNKNSKIFQFLFSTNQQHQLSFNNHHFSTPTSSPACNSILHNRNTSKIPSSISPSSHELSHYPILKLFNLLGEKNIIANRIYLENIVTLIYSITTLIPTYKSIDIDQLYTLSLSTKHNPPPPTSSSSSSSYENENKEEEEEERIQVPLESEGDDQESKNEEKEKESGKENSENVNNLPNQCPPIPKETLVILANLMTIDNYSNIIYKNLNTILLRICSNDINHKLLEDEFLLLSTIIANSIIDVLKEIMLLDHNDHNLLFFISSKSSNYCIAFLRIIKFLTINKKVFHSPLFIQNFNPLWSTLKDFLKFENNLIKESPKIKFYIESTIQIFLIPIIQCYFIINTLHIKFISLFHYHYSIDLIDNLENYLESFSSSSSPSSTSSIVSSSSNTTSTIPSSPSLASFHPVATTDPLSHVNNSSSVERSHENEGNLNRVDAMNLSSSINNNHESQNEDRVNRRNTSITSDNNSNNTTNTDININLENSINSGNSISSPGNYSGELNNEEMYKLINQLYNFCKENQTIMNILIKQDLQLLKTTLSILTKFPTLLDFDIKRYYFRSKLHERDHERNRYNGIRIGVRRDHLFEDSFHQIKKRTPDELRGRLIIQFSNEPGIDAGGLLKDWYQELSKQIFNPGYALFIQSADGSFQPNKDSHVNAHHLDFFEFCGRIIGKAIYDGANMDVHFTRSFYKHILGKKIVWKDIEAIDPEYYKSLKWLLDNDISTMDLTFSTEVNSFGYSKTVDLIANGSTIPVCESNKLEYVQLLSQFIMTSTIESQIKSFLKGFYELIPKDLICLFNELELELLISGLPDINIDDMRRNTEYTGYVYDSPIIQSFWNIVQHKFSQEERALLLQFVTGSSQVPLEGFAALKGMGGPQKFHIVRIPGDSNRLPSAHTW